MAKRRVHEIAKQLGVTSKAIIEKCQAEGLEDIVKTASSGVSIGLEETIKDWFSEADANVKHTAVETTEHVDLEKARKEADRKFKRQRSEEAAAKAEAEAKAAAEAQEAAAKAKAEDEAQAAAQAEAEAVAAAKAKAAEEAAAEQASAEVMEVVEEAPSQAVTEEASADKPKEKKPKGKKTSPKKDKADVKPAGPMVIPAPAKLKGPRVIRVEKPDYVPMPQNRPSVARSSYGAPHAPASVPLSAERARAEMSEDSKSSKSRRRTPRRKTKHSSVDRVGEKLKEWRNADLKERADRIAGAGHSLRRHRPAGGGKKRLAASGIKKGKVEVQAPISVKGLSADTGVKAADIIKKLMQMGTLATINQVISTEIAEEIMIEHGIELVVAAESTIEDKLMEKLESREKSKLSLRAPVVTFLGHVDHGKTSLLDYLRKTAVASGEAGGITQAIGAYRHDMGDGKYVVFLDTPGHEAFTAMRARGANMTDVVVLVVAADDGVMPQTVEAISHAKAAGVPIIVALNKCDVPNANPQRAMAQLAENGLQPREWGGETEVISTSAIVGTGMDDLLETLLLEAEMLELAAEKKAPGDGYVVESRMDPGRGVVATLLNVNGELKIGDNILAGKSFGRVRQIYDDKGKTLRKVGPANPVAVTGLDNVPEAGDKFYVVSDIEEARAVAELRSNETRQKELAMASGAPRNLEEMFGKISEGENTTVPLIIKADVQGSVEALVGTLEKVGSEEAKLNIIHVGVGGVTTGDVTLAEASGAIVIGFNVVADAQTRKVAEQKNVVIKSYRVIYDIVEDMRRILEEGLAPELREEEVGMAEVRQTFKVSRIGTIAGCYVTEGVADRNAKVRIIRNNVVLEDGRILDSLKRIKDDAREVKAGLECGIKIKGYDDIKEGDMIAFYKTVEVARSL